MESCQHQSKFNYIFSICLHETCAECLDEKIKDQPIQNQDGMIDQNCSLCNRNRDIFIQLQRQMINKEKERIYNLEEENKNLKQQLTDYAQKFQRIKCQTHQDKDIEFFCQKKQQLLCPTCIIEHKYHSQNIEEFDTQDILKQSEKLVPFLKILQNKNNELIEYTQQESLQRIKLIDEEYNLKKKNEEHNADIKIQEYKIQNQDIENKITSLKQVKDNSKSFSSNQILKFIEEAENLLKNKSTDDSSFYAVSLFYKKMVQQVQENLIFDSLILSDPETQKKFQIELFGEQKNLKLIYRGSRDQFSCSQFHGKLQNHQNLIFLLKSKIFDRIFGAFTDIKFIPGQGDTILNKNTFLFSQRDDSSFKKLAYKQFREISWNTTFMGWFGQGSDLVIYDNCNQNSNSYSNLESNGSSFETSNISQPNTFLAGAKHFQIEEYEVFTF